MDTFTLYTFGQRINHLRRALSWSQEFADRMLHAGQGVVRQHEAGRRKWPRLSLLRRLRYLEEIYAEEIKSYLAVAGNDRRKRIHCRPPHTGRPPDIQKALGALGRADTVRPLPKPSPIPAEVLGIRSVSKFASKHISRIDSVGSGHADDTTDRTG